MARIVAARFVETIQPSFGTMLKYGSASFITRAIEGRAFNRSK
jgi:hypothetical protein